MKRLTDKELYEIPGRTAIALEAIEDLSDDRRVPYEFVNALKGLIELTSVLALELIEERKK